MIAAMGPSTELIDQRGQITPSPIIDAHTHLFSEQVIRDRASYIGREQWFRHLYEHPAAALVDAVMLLDAMDEAGVDQAVACGFPWADIGICREENDALAFAANASGNRIFWLASVPLGGGSAAAREAERAFALGASGLGELNADAQGFDLTPPNVLAPVIDLCIAARKPMLLHASEPVGHRYPGKGGATPEKLLVLITAFPELELVLAHWGGGLPFYELMPEVRAACARVSYDSAASTYLYESPVFRRVIDLVGAERVLWGSDYPVLNMGRFLNRTRRTARLTANEERLLFADNARRIYGISTVDKEQGA